MEFIQLTFENWQEDVKTLEMDTGTGVIIGSWQGFEIVLVSYNWWQEFGGQTVVKVEVWRIHVPDAVLLEDVNH